VPEIVTLGGWLRRRHALALRGRCGCSPARIYLSRIRDPGGPVPAQAAAGLAARRRGRSAGGARGRLGHHDLAAYNAIQKLLYLGVILAGIVAVLSGLAIWKPVQLGWLTSLMGDFDAPAIVHFLA